MGRSSDKYKPLVQWLLDNQNRTFTLEDVVADGVKPDEVSVDSLRRLLNGMTHSFSNRTIYDPLRRGKMRRMASGVYLFDTTEPVESQQASWGPSPYEEPAPLTEGDLLMVEKILQNGTILVSTDSATYLFKEVVEL